MPQQQSAEAAHSDAASGHSQDLNLSSPAPDATSTRAGSARLVKQLAADKLPQRPTSCLAQQGVKPLVDTGQAATAADEADLDQEDTPATSDVQQAADESMLLVTETEQTSELVKTGQKRKRQPKRGSQQPEVAGTADAPVQPNSRVRVREQSTPLPLQSKKGRAHQASTPRQAVASSSAISADDADPDASNSLRRTGRQRKLTAAAAAAVEDFPSLYRQPTPTHARFRQSPTADSVGTSEDASAEAPASSGRAPAKRGSAKHGKARESPALPGLNHVQMRQLVRYGVIPAGTHEFVYNGRHPCEVEVLPDGEQSARTVVDKLVTMHAFQADSHADACNFRP